MASNANLLLSSVRVPASQSLSGLMASTNQVLLGMNNQMQQIGSAFTLTKPTVTRDSSTGGITVGNITMGSTNYIRGGAIGYNNGIGFWLGYDTTPTVGYKFFVGNSLGNKLTWDGSTLAITGTITATTGTIGGWAIGTTTISALSNKIVLDSTQGSIRAGQTDYDTGTGFWLGNTTGTPKFSIGSTSNYFKWDGTNVLVLGGVSPNNVIIDNTGFTVGVTNGRRVAVGTFSGNAASLNFYTSTNIPRLGIYLSGGITPTIDFANSGTSGNNSSATIQCTANTYFVSFNSNDSTYGNSKFESYSTFGTSEFGISGYAGTLGTGPSFSVYRLDTNTTARVYSNKITLVNVSASTDLLIESNKFTFNSDTNLYRSAAGVLKTDNSLTIAGTMAFGTYTGTILTIAGYITINDSAGNARKLAVVA